MFDRGCLFDSKEVNYVINRDFTVTINKIRRKVVRNFEDAKREVIELFASGRWVRWIHEGFRPAYTDREKNDNINLSITMVGKHCSICLNINGCCFPKNNMPEYSLHPNCHCFIVPVYDLTVKAECKISKFRDYVFHPDNNRVKKPCMRAGDMI